MGDAKSTLSVEEIRMDLGLGKAKVYELLEAREIPNVRVGRTYLVTRRAYEAWKERCGVGVSSPAAVTVN